MNPTAELAKEEQVRYHLIGCGGSGMMPLALLMPSAPVFSGAQISGSDRAFDRDPADPRRRELERSGVVIHSQQGGGAAGAIAIVSTAIESSNPDLVGVKGTRHRSDVLEEIVRTLGQEGRSNILIGGSSGKTTTTAMIGWIALRLGLDPLLYVGGSVLELAPHGARWGRGPVIVEVDESDGSIERFTADISVVTSVSEDHKPLPEIEEMFRRFLARSAKQVVSEQAAYLLSDQVEGDVTRIARLTKGVSWSAIPGAFNRINEALAVEAVCSLCSLGSPGSQDVPGVDRESAQKALSDFPGVGRRLEMIASSHDRHVLDDFAHNPEKIAAALDAAKEWGHPVMAIYQPHGYGPLRMQKDALGKLFSSALGKRDAVMLLPVYDAGGTADRSIRSEDLAVLISGPRAMVPATRSEAVQIADEFMREPSTVIVMGARDPSLADFARQIGERLLSR